MSAGTERLIDPDCRDEFKHATCVGGPCECQCHRIGVDRYLEQRAFDKRMLDAT